MKGRPRMLWAVKDHPRSKVVHLFDVVPTVSESGAARWWGAKNGSVGTLPTSALDVRVPSRHPIRIYLRAEVAR